MQAESGKKRQGWISLFSHYIPLRFVRKFNFVLCTRRYHCWCYGYTQLLCTIPKLVKACTWFYIAAQWKIYNKSNVFFFKVEKKRWAWYTCMSKKATSNLLIVVSTHNRNKICYLATALLIPPRFFFELVARHRQKRLLSWW